jgi:hypothetical protein
MAQLCESSLAAFLVASHHYDARTHCRQGYGRGPADARCCAGDDAGLSLHAHSELSVVLLVGLPLTGHQTPYAAYHA